MTTGATGDMVLPKLPAIQHNAPNWAGSSSGPNPFKNDSANVKIGPDPEPESTASPQGKATARISMPPGIPSSIARMLCETPSAASPAPKHWAEMIIEMILP